MVTGSPAEHPSGAVTRTVFLVRHGEAVHNIAEKAAKKRAGAEAEASGLAKGSEAHAAAMESARKSVLHSEDFRDAALSDVGTREAVEARCLVDSLVGRGLPEPSRVFVSPLQRTLQTAAAAFPGHEHVDVREEVRERRTGLPCDTRARASTIARRTSFSYMQWGQMLQDEASSPDVREVAEDAKQLRLRTAELGSLLRATEDKSVCIVTHKGYLRELERGPFARPESPEFGNGEVRVYDVTITPDGEMSANLVYMKGTQDFIAPRRNLGQSSPLSKRRVASLPNLCERERMAGA